MKKSVVKLNESALRQIVAESVKKVLKEYAEGNEMSPIPGENYDPTASSLLEDIVSTTQHLDECRGKAERCLINGDVKNARELLREIGYDADVILDRAKDLKGFIEMSTENGDDVDNI